MYAYIHIMQNTCRPPRVAHARR